MKGVPKELSPLRIALLVLYSTARTEYADRIVPGANAYRIEKQIRSGLGGVRGYGKTAVYTNSRQLAELGYLEAVRVGEPSKPVTAYIVTEQGTEAIKEWMKTPIAPPPLDDEIFVRARVLDYVPAADALRSLASLRPHLATRLAVVEHEKAATDPGMLGPMLGLEYFELVLQAHVKWLDRAEKALKQRDKENRAHRQRRRAR